MKVFLADKSVGQPADQHELFQFTKKYIGATSNDNFVTLDSLVNRTFDKILQSHGLVHTHPNNVSPVLSLISPNNGVIPLCLSI